VAWL